MTDHSGKTFPRITPETAPYWEGCREHELRLQYCGSCDHYQFYPRIMCSHCMSDQLQWVAASGAGEVTSFTVVRRAVSEAYRPDVPYVVALVQLAKLVVPFQRCWSRNLEMRTQIRKEPRTGV